MGWTSSVFPLPPPFTSCYTFFLVLSFLKMFSVSFLDNKSSSLISQMPMCTNCSESHEGFLRVLEKSADRYSCSMFTLSLKPKVPNLRTCSLSSTIVPWGWPPRLSWEQLQMLTDAISAIWRYKKWSQVPRVGYCKAVPRMLKKIILQQMNIWGSRWPLIVRIWLT